MWFGSYRSVRMSPMVRIGMSVLKSISFDYKLEDGNYRVVSTGTYRDIQMRIEMEITPCGVLDIHYKTAGAPNGYLRESGLAFHLSDCFDRVEWYRKGYWDSYPEDAFAGNKGTVWLYRSRQVGYGERPVQPWHYDTHNYYYWADAGANCKQPLTQMAKGMKEHVYYYSLAGEGSMAICCQFVPRMPLWLVGFRRGLMRVCSCMWTTDGTIRK